MLRSKWLNGSEIYLKKKKYLLLAGLFIILFSGVYRYYDSVSMSGISENKMWKATYKKNLDESEPTAWLGKLKQKNERNVDVKSIVFLEDDKILMKTTLFPEGRAEDGSVITLHPFSSDFYLGDAPKKSHDYKVSVTWEENKKAYTDTFEIH